MNDKQIEMVDEINYVGVTLENAGGWNKQRATLRAKGSQAVAAVGKYLSKSPGMRVEMLENDCEMVIVDVWRRGVGLEETW